MILPGKKLSAAQIYIYKSALLPSLPQTRFRLPDLCDWLNNSALTIWCAADSVFQKLNSCFQASFFNKPVAFVCLLTKSQDSRKWSSYSDLVALKGRQEAKTIAEKMGQEARLKQWLHRPTFAVAGGCGCMFQGVAYYKYMAHDVHSNEIVR